MTVTVTVAPVPLGFGAHGIELARPGVAFIRACKVLHEAVENSDDVTKWHWQQGCADGVPHQSCDVPRLCDRGRGTLPLRAGVGARRRAG